MLCQNCSKLYSLYAQKFCINCQGIVNNSISILCEHCSERDKMCASCLKKNIIIKINYNGGCKSCGK